MENDVIQEENVENDDELSVNITGYKASNNKKDKKIVSKEDKERDKERKERMKRVQERMINRPKIQIYETTFYIACYDPFKRELYYLNFNNESVIRKEVDIEEHEILEELPKRYLEYDKKWKDIIKIADLEGNSFIEDQFYKYLSRPLNSSLLYPESIGLNNFNSTYPIPGCFANYDINLIITFHSSVIQDDNKSIPLKDLIINRKVGFYYVVDTIIKDSLRVLLGRLKSIVKQDGDDDEDNNNVDKVSKNISELGSKLSKNIKSGKYKFVLKLKSYEEYLFGDNPICTYDSIRTLVREFEPVSLFLMMYDRERVIPSITHYPPLLYIQENTSTDFYDLTHRFFNLFPENCIMFKPIPDIKLHEYYFKPKINKRREYLQKYCETGEADFPFSFTVKSINNLFALKYHIDTKSYNDVEVILPYFTELINIEHVKSKKNLCEKMYLKLMNICKKKDKKDDKNAENQEQKEKKEDEKHHKELHKAIMTKYPKNINLHNELNNLKIVRNKKNKDNAFKNIFSIKSNIPIYKINKLSKVSNLLRDYNTMRVCYYQYFIDEKEVVEEKKELNSINESSEKNGNLLKNEDYENREFDYEDKIRSVLFEESLLLEEYYYPNNIIPALLKMEIMLYYGCYELYSVETRVYIINNNINIAEKINIPNLLISHLPKETRISINLICYDKLKSKSFVLGCCSAAIFDENGVLKEGPIELNIWPLYKIDPRIVCTNNYMGKHYIHDKDSKEPYDKMKFCSMIIELPKYARKPIYTLKSPFSYKEFLKLKYPNYENKVNQCGEILSLYSSSLDHLSSIINSLKNRDQYFTDIDKKQKKILINAKNKKEEENNDESKPLMHNTNVLNNNLNIWDILEYSLPLVKDIIVRDPLSPLTREERDIVLYCRDYICTIPSALEIFLKSINWLDPLQVHLAKNYLKKWKKITPEDAISLLDARFPDSHVREYAISVLRDMTDDLMNLYMLQMCQCLVFEPQVVNPLSDFLVEKSIQNPTQVGVIFFWNACVSMKNPLFKQRLSIILSFIFSIKGPQFFTQMNKSNDFYKEMYLIGRDGKAKFAMSPGSNEDKKNATKAFVQERLKNMRINGEKVENFYFPIHNSYYGKYIDSEISSVFGSKMVPIKISAVSSDDSILNVIFKSGDDLRQDVLTLQILKVMDKMWLENDLDLKITSYKVLPTGITEGFIQFITGKEIDGLQMVQGFAGALDRELLLKYLRKQGLEIVNGAPRYDLIKQQENFVKSLAGFCVATCVMGIGDRHLGNVMIKDNGIFFHIDYGHILGNVKYKFGIKRERAPFLLTPEMAHVYTKTGREDQFKLCCVKAYNILRKNANRLINLYIIMSTAGLPELNSITDVIFLRDRLNLDKKNDEDAGNYFIGLINQSKNEKFRLFDNIIHNFKHG